MRDIPNPKLYDEALAEITDGVRKDLLAQIDTLRSVAEDERVDLDALLAKANRVLEHMQQYVDCVEGDKSRLDHLFLNSPIRKHFSLSANYKDESYE